ncbi:hypothetical protein ARMGADRAFT_483912 [Armillaria gallica]|uniref:Uncharacterized protein n=1 Tax=Armillaria gallica TaxID=47427 RepID=A0A2H3DYG6_ARMGA|nr:hypothetical protein ARMGADRAFT_483912 [Armillaria gallica]
MSSRCKVSVSLIDHFLSHSIFICGPRNRKYGDRLPTDQSTVNQLFFLDGALYVVEQAAVVDLSRIKPRDTLVSTLLDTRSMLRASHSSR